MRHDYASHGLAESECAADPLDQFQRWFAEAVAAGVTEPNAMVLATVDAAGRPTTRHVLLKGLSEGGFEFFTNYASSKGMHLAANDAASLTFGWLALHRQVNLVGRTTRLSSDESDAYFALRPREAQLGAWASSQSVPLSGRQQLEEQLAEAARRFESQTVPRPAHWGGYRFLPRSIEFWQGRPSRLHDRLRYDLVDGTWSLARLSP